MYEMKNNSNDMRDATNPIIQAEIDECLETIDNLLSKCRADNERCLEIRLDKYPLIKRHVLEIAEILIKMKFKPTVTKNITSAMLGYNEYIALKVEWMI